MVSTRKAGSNCNNSRIPHAAKCYSHHETSRISAALHCPMHQRDVSGVGHRGSVHLEMQHRRLSARKSKSMSNTPKSADAQRIAFDNDHRCRCVRSVFSARLPDFRYPAREPGGTSGVSRRELPSDGLGIHRAYILIVAFSLPGATIATLTGGFLFRTFPGALFNITRGDHRRDSHLSGRALGLGREAGSKNGQL